jgi:hypothetical protein
MAADPDKPTLSERFTRAVIKADSTQPKVDDGPKTVDEIEASIARANDKERLIGLIGAPIAGAIGLVVMQSLVASNAKSYSSVSLTLTLTLLGLAAVMLAAAWFRKRLYMGLAMVLYGLSIFNLHFWGFGVPYLLFGSWYLVRAYRLQQSLKLAKEDGSSGRSGTVQRQAQPSKRFTPPVAPPVKPAKLPKAPKTDSGT